MQHKQIYANKYAEDIFVLARGGITRGHHFKIAHEICSNVL